MGLSDLCFQEHDQLGVEVRTPTELTPQQRELLNEFARLDTERGSAGSQPGS